MSEERSAEHQSATSGDGPDVGPLAVPMRPIVVCGIVAWALALAATLAVPALHTGGRWWWPWCCVAGIVLGLAGLAYLRRGRGNAADAPLS